MSATIRPFCQSSLSPTTPPPQPSLSARPTAASIPTPTTNSVSTSSLAIDPANFVLPDLPSDTKEKILSLELLGIDSTKALSKNPSFLSAPADSIHSLISFLLSRGIHHKDLPRIFGMCPSLLTADIRSDVAPVFRFLSEDLGVPNSAFRKPINKCPRLLTASVRDQLKPALFYLRRLGFRDNLALAYRDPLLLVSSVEGTLIPRLEYLQSVGYTREDAVWMVQRCPTLFTISIENNFRPKMSYYLQEMKGGLAELRDFPQFFTFNLEKRIKARHRRVVESGVEVPLAVMLKANDEEFAGLLPETKVS